MNKYTKMLKKEEVSRKWYHIDADGQILGRLAAEVATMVMGKKKVSYTPHVDNGDYVVITNAEKIAVTGNKMADKKYYRHSGFPGGMKVRTLEELLAKKPEDAILLAVKNMLPKNKLGREMLKRVKVYAGNEHGHIAQKPETVEL
ncbi:LSU ribosomal protein L13P [Hypnocyclicus thermotrophus]|uniref:Large ribosomal subunit protein uL13 n=1 Tax=Hypnocyclicus thermotrophus TaxID=1627895 RepID=A0AA46DZC9_9FUSO|nr:LSU ribosomal protein L13P [Hypnocyclicus thermotrophus]